MSWAEMKKAVNSTVGEPDFKPLDKIMEDLLLPTAELNINENGEYDVKKYGFARVSVPTTAETPEITISESTGLISADSAGMKSTKQLPTTAEKTYTPTNSDQTIDRYSWLTGDQIIKGDPNLVPENIPKGITLFGIPGSFSSTPRSANILLNVADYITAYYTHQGDEQNEFITLDAGGAVISETVPLNSIICFELHAGYPASGMTISTEFDEILYGNDSMRRLFVVDGDGYIDAD